MDTGCSGLTSSPSPGRAAVVICALHGAFPSHPCCVPAGPPLITEQRTRPTLGYRDRGVGQLVTLGSQEGRTAAAQSTHFNPSRPHTQECVFPIQLPGSTLREVFPWQPKGS